MFEKRIFTDPVYRVSPKQEDGNYQVYSIVYGIAEKSTTTYRNSCGIFSTKKAAVAAKEKLQNLTKEKVNANC